MMQFHSWVRIWSKGNHYLKKASAVPCPLQLLLTTAKTWKQPICLSTDKWVNERRIYMIELLFSYKKKKRRQHGWTSRALC